MQNSIKIDFYPLEYVEDEKLKYAVVIASYRGKWIFVRQKGKKTWEIPAGRKEPTEDILKTACREIAEETGALEFKMKPVMVYSVKDSFGLNYGQLFYCKIDSLSDQLEYEIEEICFSEKIPENLSYPLIQPILFEKVRKTVAGSKKIRVFLGIKLSGSLKSQIESYQSRLKEHSLKAKWKDPENFHITIKYLGDIEADMIPKIDGVMKNIKSSVINLRVSEISAFKKKEKLRVIYLSLEGDLNQLNKLYEKVEMTMNNLGFKLENRSYTPHITLAQDVTLTEKLEGLKSTIENPQFEPIKVESITLFESKQENGKRKYVSLKDYSLT